jgi:hypothetical protein
VIPMPGAVATDQTQLRVGGSPMTTTTYPADRTALLIVDPS